MASSGLDAELRAHARAIASVAQKLKERREAWLNPIGVNVNSAILQDRTMTELYNRRPDWLIDVHGELDEAVCAAYGWSADIADDEVLARLLELNRERAEAEE